MTVLRKVSPDEFLACCVRSYRRCLSRRSICTPIDQVFTPSIPNIMMHIATTALLTISAGYIGREDQYQTGERTSDTSTGILQGRNAGLGAPTERGYHYALFQTTRQTAESGVYSALIRTEFPAGSSDGGCKPDMTPSNRWLLVHLRLSARWELYLLKFCKF